MSDSYAYGFWSAVVINAAIFIFFALGFLRPRRRWEWRSMGTFSAFVVALFAEMYGFPLTIYALASVLGSKYPVTNIFSHSNGNLLAVFLGGSEHSAALLMLIAWGPMLAGLVIMGKAWSEIRKAKGQLVTSGLYSRMRHPQYFGLFLITVGMLIQWPTIITVAMWPALMVMYYRLSRREEKDMEIEFGAQYRTYKRLVPMFPP